MIEQRPWSDEAADALLSAAGDRQTLSSVADEVAAKTSQLWRFETAAITGWLVTRVEIGPYGLELVIVLGAGRGARSLIPWAKQLAKNHGIKRVRTHVKRPGLVRLYQREGFQIDQTVMVHSDGQ